MIPNARNRQKLESHLASSVSKDCYLLIKVVCKRQAPATTKKRVTMTPDTPRRTHIWMLFLFVVALHCIGLAQHRYITCAPIACMHPWPLAMCCHFKEIAATSDFFCDSVRQNIKFCNSGVIIEKGSMNFPKYFVYQISETAKESQNQTNWSLPDFILNAFSNKKTALWIDEFTAK